MSEVHLIEVILKPHEHYEYGMEYTHAKKILKSRRLSATEMPWMTMNHVLRLSTTNKESHPPSAEPICVEIVLIKNVFVDRND
jgi:hypothetical protein